VRHFYLKRREQNDRGMILDEPLSRSALAISWIVSPRFSAACCRLLSAPSCPSII